MTPETNPASLSASGDEAIGEAIRRVDVAEARRLIDQGYVYVDVRSVFEYAAGHPVGAHNVPWLCAEAGGLRENPHFSRVMAALHPPGSKIIIGCQSGKRSLRAAAALVAAGHAEIVELRPGYGGRKNAFGGVEEPGWAASAPSERITPGGSYDELRAKVGL